MQKSSHPATPAPAASFSLPVRVYYEDTDAAGVVYYANYLCYCERARTEWLRALGFEQQKMRLDHGLAFVVRSVKADYLSPGMLDDALEVVTRIDALGGASIVFAQTIERGGKALFEGRFVIACVDLNKKRPAPLPADVRAQLEKAISA